MAKIFGSLAAGILFSACSIQQTQQFDMRPNYNGEISSITLEENMPDVKRYMTPKTNNSSYSRSDNVIQVGYVFDGKDTGNFDVIEGYIICNGKKEDKPFVVHVPSINTALFDGDRNGKIDLIKKIPYCSVMKYAPSCKKPQIIE